MKIKFVYRSRQTFSLMEAKQSDNNIFQQTQKFYKENSLKRMELKICDANLSEISTLYWSGFLYSHLLEQRFYTRRVNDHVASARACAHMIYIRIVKGQNLNVKTDRNIATNYFFFFS